MKISNFIGIGIMIISLGLLSGAEADAQNAKRPTPNYELASRY